MGRLGLVRFLRRASVILYRQQIKKNTISFQFSTDSNGTVLTLFDENLLIGSTAPLGRYQHTEVATRTSHLIK